MAQPLQYGKDMERELMDSMEQQKGNFYNSGGIASSDTVAAMLTPGEYVVNRDAVARWGAGFFESLNNLQMPAQALAARVQGFSEGGWVQSRPSTVSAGSVNWPNEASPVRTVRVELAAGSHTVSATIAASDEARLLDLLQQARARA